MARKKIDEMTRHQVLNAFEDGVARKKIAEQCGISVSSVNRIIKERGATQTLKRLERDSAKDAEMQKKIADIERRIAELEKKISYYESKKRGLGRWS